MGKEAAALKGPEPAPGQWPTDYDKLTHEEKRKYHENEGKLLAISPDGKLFAVGTGGGWVSVWDVARRRRLWRKSAGDSPIFSLAFSGDSSLVMSGGGSGLIFWVATAGRRRMATGGRGRDYLYLPDNTILYGSRQSYHGFFRWDPVEDRLDGEGWEIPRNAPWRPGPAGPARPCSSPSPPTERRWSPRAKRCTSGT